MVETSKFTPARKDQLRSLLAAGAIDSDRAKGPHDRMAMCNQLVLGALRDMGLVKSRVVRAKGASQFTAYWLSPIGVEAAKMYAEEVQA